MLARDAQAAAAAMRDHLRWAAQRRPARPRRAGRAALHDGDGRGVAMGVVVGIDTGGTFTDLVVFDPATGEVDSLKTSSTPATPGQAIVERARRGRRRRGRHRHVHARDDGRHERADRAHGLQGRVRDDQGLRGHAVHPADQPQGPLRPPLDASPRRSSRAGATASGSTERIDAEGDEVLASRRGRGARALPAGSASRAPRRSRSACSSRTSTPSTRSRVEADRRARSCRACRSRSRTRSRRSGASTSARRRRSPTPT